MGPPPSSYYDDVIVVPYDVVVCVWAPLLVHMYLLWNAMIYVVSMVRASVSAMTPTSVISAVEILPPPLAWSLPLLLTFLMGRPAWVGCAAQALASPPHKTSSTDYLTSSRT